MTIDPGSAPHLGKIHRPGDDPPPTAAERADAKNVGHGHVFPRPDGRKARCGGPALCAECARDLARKTAQGHGGPQHTCDSDCPGWRPTKQVAEVAVRVVPEFDVVSFLRTAADQMHAEADRIEHERKHVQRWGDTPERAYCGAVQTNNRPEDLPYKCTRDAGHDDTIGHGHAGIFWQGDRREGI